MERPDLFRHFKTKALRSIHVWGLRIKSRVFSLCVNEYLFFSSSLLFAGIKETNETRKKIANISLTCRNVSLRIVIYTDLYIP